MIAAVSSPVSSSSARNSFVPPSLGGPSVSRPSLGRRQQRQRFLEWDRDEAAETRGPAISRTVASTERAPIEHATAAGPRRMGDVMPDVLARYGLKL